MAHLVLPCASSGARPPEAYHASLHSLPPLRQVRPCGPLGPPSRPRALAAAPAPSTMGVRHVRFFSVYPRALAASLLPST
jgi:hypothetical protein